MEAGGEKCTSGEVKKKDMLKAQHPPDLNSSSVIFLFWLREVSYVNSLSHLRSHILIVLHVLDDATPTEER